MRSAALPSFLLLQPLAQRRVRRDDGSLIRRVDHHAGLRARRLFDKFHRRIIDRHVLAVAGLRIIRRKLHRLRHRPIGRRPAVRFDDDVAAGDLLDVQPDVRFRGQLRRQLVVLPVAAADKIGKPSDDMNRMGRLGGSFMRFLRSVSRR